MPFSFIGLSPLAGSTGMLEYPVRLALIFFAYSFLGWCIEVTLKYFQFHRFINRGFLAGPWLPIYGSGAALITLAADAVSRYDFSLGTIFVISFLICGAVEYSASWYMEKRFHARWWDYSQKPMNLHGRIWIGNLILFGLGGVAIVFIGNPVLARFFGQMQPALKESLAGFLTVLIAADYTMSHFILKLVKAGIEHSEADNTEEIGREIRLLLKDRSYFHRRFADAYPEVIYRTEKIAARMEAVIEETEKLRHEAEQRFDASRERIAERMDQLAAEFESTGSIRDGIIKDQNELIGLLYDEAQATDQMKSLKEKIEADQERLEKRKAVF